MASLKGARVLVVDDDAQTCRLMQAFLSWEGYCVVTVERGTEALEQIGRERWDVVLLDVNMPEMNGYEVLERIRKAHSLTQLPVIVISGRQDLESRLHGLHLQANEFLVKPVDQLELLARINTVLIIHRADSEMKEKVKEIERAQTVKDLLINSLIHDLRAPLTIVRAYVSLVLDKLEGQQGSRIGEYLKKSEAAVNRAIEMATDAVAVSCMEEHSLVPRCEEIDIENLIHARLESFRGLAATQGLELLAKTAVERSLVRADRKLTERILDNLLMNSIKHTPEGGRVEVAVAPSSERGDMVITVKDTGKGIPSTDLNKVFDKFWQVDPGEEGSNRGMGLGLAFCKLAVAAQGGTIWAESELGYWTTFSFTLPRLDPALRQPSPRRELVP